MARQARRRKPHNRRGRLRRLKKQPKANHLHRPVRHATWRAASRSDCLPAPRQELRRPRSRGDDRRGQLLRMQSIHLRPPEADARLIPGHWEVYLVKGAFNRSAVGTLVERSTRLLILARMPDASAASALAGFSAALEGVTPPLRKTFTYDQGREMSPHRQLADQTGVQVYFCDPHSPW